MRLLDLSKRTNKGHLFGGVLFRFNDRHCYNPLTLVFIRRKR